jgi:hypothetical protein
MEEEEEGEREPHYLMLLREIHDSQVLYLCVV